jgi:hypothetical protein
MNDKFSKILTWAGVIALISLPIILLKKKDRSAFSEESDEEYGIFDDDLEERTRKAQ